MDFEKLADIFINIQMSVNYKARSFLFQEKAD